MSKPSSDYYTSPLSQFCAEQLPGDFHFFDGDEVLLRYSSQALTYARFSGVLRVLESKRPGEDLRRSQREVFPLFASAIHCAIVRGLLARGSGVFVVEGDSPYDDGALVSQVLPAGVSRASGLQILGPKHLDRTQLNDFLRCRNVDLREERDE